MLLHCFFTESWLNIQLYLEITMILRYTNMFSLIIKTSHWEIFIWKLLFHLWKFTFIIFYFLEGISSNDSSVSFTIWKKCFKLFCTVFLIAFVYEGLFCCDFQYHFYILTFTHKHTPTHKCKHMYIHAHLWIYMKYVFMSTSTSCTIFKS